MLIDNEDIVKMLTPRYIIRKTSMFDLSQLGLSRLISAHTMPINLPAKHYSSHQPKCLNQSKHKELSYYLS
jgi:hypothetical protein